MKQGNFRKKVANEIAKKTLTSQQLSELMKLQKNNRKSSFTLRPQLIAALTFIAIATFTLQNTFTTDLTIEQKIANEVAKNHIKLKPLEIQSSQLNVLRQYFSELDFSPISSANINLNTKALLGGRYCSIQGITAAQLRLKNNKTGELQSLYQTLYDPDVFTNLPNLSEGQVPVTAHAKGLTVDIWVEKGLLFALTKN